VERIQHLSVYRECLGKSASICGHVTSHHFPFLGLLLQVARQGRSVSDERKGEREGTAFAWFTFQPGASPMVSDHSGTDIEADPQPFGLRRLLSVCPVEQVEDRLLILRNSLVL
jgi:hypothetical protein